MKNKKHHKLRDPLRRYVRNRVIRFRETHGVIHLSDFGREEMEDSDQALENRIATQATELQEVDHFEIIITQKIELNIKEIIIDQL